MKTARNRTRLLVALLALAFAGTARADGVWIGVEVEPGAAGGLRVKRVMQGSPGEKAHLQPGWEVLAVDGQSVAKTEQLVRYVQSKAPGSVVRLTLAGSAGAPPREVSVTLTARPDPASYQRDTLVGKPAPDFTGETAAGPRIASLASLRGRVVLIDFWATWCMPCMQALPSVEAMHQRLAKKGLTVIGVSGDPAALVTSTARRKHLSYSLVADPGEGIQALYHVYAIPTAIVIDRAGVVRSIQVADVRGTERIIEELLAAKP